ncbi:MAG: TIGR01620 family protein, partial [Halomonas sp. BM-2019]
MNAPRDPRPGQRFAPEAGEAESPPPRDPRPAEPFASDLASRPLADAPPGPAERALEASLARPRRRRWGLLALVPGTLGLGALEAGGTLYAA